MVAVTTVEIQINTVVTPSYPSAAPQWDTSLPVHGRIMAGHVSDIGAHNIIMSFIII